MLLKVNKEMLADAMESIGAHKASLPIFANKNQILPLKLLQVRTPAANIIKQEMLAAGGDAAVPTGCVLNKDKYSDVLLLGTRKHYNLLLKKLELMPYFGMDKVKAELEAVLNEEKLQTVLADGRVLNYDKVLIMGILNITPDSFYENSRTAIEEVVAKAGQMLADGADILDIGGESTRPGSEAVAAEEEQARVLPVIKALRKAYPDAALSKEKIGGFSTVNIEKVSVLNPDLIVAADGNSEETVSHLRELGFTVITNNADTIDTTLDDILLLGKATGADDEAEALVSSMKEDLAEIAEKTSAEGQ